MYSKMGAIDSLWVLVILILCVVFFGLLNFKLMCTWNSLVYLVPEFNQAYFGIAYSLVTFIIFVMLHGFAEERFYNAKFKTYTWVMMGIFHPIISSCMISLKWLYLLAYCIDDDDALVHIFTFFVLINLLICFISTILGYKKGVLCRGMFHLCLFIYCCFMRSKIRQAPEKIFESSENNLMNRMMELSTFKSCG